MEAVEASGDPAGSSYLLLSGPCLHGLTPDITQVAGEVKIQPRVETKQNKQTNKQKNPPKMYCKWQTVARPSNPS